jgi:hypothetical protein
MTPTTDRTRIFSHITRTRFLHIEDSLEIGKIRLFVGEYQKGQGAQSTAYHFLDADDARPICADLAWGKALDIKDYKGSANGGDVPLSRVLTIRGPKDGKYWLEVANGPGQVIGQGAVKPAGEPEASVSIALSLWEARKMALAIQEYMAAYRVAALLSPSEASRPPVDPAGRNKPPEDPPSPPPMPKVEGRTSARDDAEALFGPESPPVPATTIVDQDTGRVRQVKATHRDANPGEGGPPAFYSLAKLAIEAGLLEVVNELVQAPGSWREKSERLQQAMAA